MKKLIAAEADFSARVFSLLFYLNFREDSYTYLYIRGEKWNDGIRMSLKLKARFTGLHSSLN